MTVADTYKTDPVKGGPDGGVMRRLNMVTGVAGGVLLALVFNLVAKSFAKDAVHEVDVRATATMVGWAIGFMAGMGAFTGPFRWMVGPRPHPRRRAVPGRQGPGCRAILPVHHRPQGGRDPVPRAHHGHARRGRHDGHAHPHRPDLAELGVPRTADLQLAGRAPRADHDPGHDHHGHRTVRELRGSADDRRARHGIPATQRAQPVAARGHAPGAVLRCLPRRHPDGLGRLHADR